MQMKSVIMIHSNPQPWGHPTSDYLAAHQDLPAETRERLGAEFEAVMSELHGNGELVGAEALGDPATAAVHAEAATCAETDWLQISVLYDMLGRIAPAPAVTLNHAVAVAMAHDPAAGLAVLAPLADDPATRGHHRLYAVRAHLRELDGDVTGAVGDYRRAAQLTASLPEQRYLHGRLARLER